jgi:hypothetical protein
MPLNRATEAAKWVCAALSVLLLIVTVPLWGIPYLLWQLFGPMVRDMKKVIDGKMRLW